MIGNREDALEVLEGYVPMYSRLGSTRYVYLIDNVIYKVDISDSELSDNFAEYDNISKYKDDLPEGIYFPETELYEFGRQCVIAMEFIEGTILSECTCAGIEECTDNCMPQDIYNKVSGIIGDTGGDNVIVKDNGDVYIIDVAM